MECFDWIQYECEYQNEKNQGTNVGWNANVTAVQKTKHAERPTYA